MSGHDMKMERVRPAELRDTLAGNVLTGLLAFHGRYWQNGYGIGAGGDENLHGLLPDDAADTAYKYADAMMERRKK